MSSRSTDNDTSYEKYTLRVGLIHFAHTHMSVIIAPIDRARGVRNRCMSAMPACQVAMQPCNLHASLYATNAMCDVLTGVRLDGNGVRLVLCYQSILRATAVYPTATAYTSTIVCITCVATSFATEPDTCAYTGWLG